MNEKKYTVLIIDDDQDICDLVSRILSETEYRVVQALNGREGIQIAKDHKPDLILLDIKMPTIDGFMTGKVFKRNLSTKNIPIIFLSGKKSLQDINAAIQAGGSDYIVKPFGSSDLLTRIRRTVTSQETILARKKKSQETPDSQPETVNDDQEFQVQDIYNKKIIRHGDIIVCSDISNSIEMKNCAIYRGIFSNIVYDGFLKVVLDMKNIERIDGAGLALLVSVNESLKRYDGELRITFPRSRISNKISYVKLNELFRGYDTVNCAVDSFQKTDSNAKMINNEVLNICISCTYVNNSDARFCAYCGTNLIMSKNEKILEVMKTVIAHRIVDEAQTIDTHEINKNRNIEAEDYDIPSEFNVILYDENFSLKYKSIRTIRKYFESYSQIGIQLPEIYGNIIHFRPGTKLQLSGAKSGAFSTYETEIKSVDDNNGIVFVHYSEDAKVILSQKFFSIAPSLPIPISLISPSFGNTGSIMNGKILEISRVRMVVFSEDFLPEDECLAVNFVIIEGHEISSPLVIAKKRRERFMYNIEFIMIDEKEKSKIIQYMYKRQIELAKS